MSNQNTLLGLRPTPANLPDRADQAANRRFRPLLVVVALTTLFLTACDLGGGGSGGSAAGPPSTTSGTPSAVNRIDLPAGQLQATLGWAPSEGEVDQYFVYESRNGSEFTYAQAVPTERATVSGTDGEFVQLVVVAVTDDGLLSNGSAPSPQLVFHGSAQAVTALSEAPAAPSFAVSSAGSTSSSSSSSDSNASATQTANAVDAQEDTSLAAEPVEAVEESDKLSGSMRDLLVRADARFPVAGLSQNAATWLEAEVEKQFSAGVRLVGTGLRDADEYRELIWQDSAGQLLISDGRAVVALDDSADIPTTFEEGIRLGATERFIGLSDFDGDARGDWLIEDTSTGDVSIIDGESLETFDARTADTLDAILVGHGDFDGNGLSELVWRSNEGWLQVTTPTASATIPAADFEMNLESQLLAVADLDGDGRDDLLLLDTDGLVSRAMNTLRSGMVEFVLQAGPAQTVDARELLVTLDADEDGNADIAWWHEGDFELWDTQQGARDF